VVSPTIASATKGAHLLPYALILRKILAAHDGKWTVVKINGDHVKQVLGH